MKSGAAEPILDAMAALPNRERVVFDIRKLEDYCLDPNHPRGRHKARVFRDALGIGKGEAVWLRDALLAATDGDAEEMGRDGYGTSWRLDVPLARHGKQAVVRSIWMVRTSEDALRFVTCWVL
ncbi:MAG: hypothetical protein KGJ79_13460 [Alphaproteobacteria bacterium]|nr:hypothetical protein [Alphaproteobacteria bacterium]MDE2112145.1 hypothetical protein [Alphaproteobacteria bacterium]